MISGQTMPNELNLGSMTKELRHDFTALKYFSELGPVTRVDNEEGKRLQIYDSDKLFLVERSLLTLSNAWGPGKFAASGCIAATIFLDNYIRGIAFRARIMAGSPYERGPSYTLRNNKESRLTRTLIGSIGCPTPILDEYGSQQYHTPQLQRGQLQSHAMGSLRRRSCSRSPF